jgi:uncharacterized protein YciI
VKYLVITLRKPTFREAVVDAHYGFLDELRRSGALEVAGPFTDGTGGAYVLKAESLEAARAIAQSDPLHLEGCSTVTVREWRAR